MTVAEYVPAVIHRSGKSDWRTPPAMAQKLVKIFGCTIDLASDERSAVCPAWLGPGSEHPDALAVEWSMATIGHDVGFLNCPYSLDEIKALRKAGAAPDDPRIRAMKIEAWAQHAYASSLGGFTTIAVMPYSPQTKWYRRYAMGHLGRTWAGHAALDVWRLPHRVPFLRPDGSPAGGAGVNTCVVHWGPNPGFQGPWVPSERFWSYR